MAGYIALLLHAHLPFVRHPEHETFLEESWLFEAITETYVPLLQTLEGWQRDGLAAPVTLSLTPTLCAMLQDPLLQERYQRHLDALIELAEKELHRTRWEQPFHELALFYHQRFCSIRDYYRACGGELVGAFRRLQDNGRLEIITSAATHAVLPLLASHPPSVRAQLLVARDHYRSCFGQEPRGIWLPECAYSEGLESLLEEAGLRWFLVDAHGLLKARSKPRFAVFAPILTPKGIAAFGRDLESAKQVWSRQEGYPGDFNYRDFYRDVGFDLELEYLKPHLAASDHRSFTGIKYYRITGSAGDKKLYDRKAALAMAQQHARHFLEARTAQVSRLTEALDRPPLIVAPYDAELFGHWWYEGIEFLDFFVRGVCSAKKGLEFITPSEYLRRHPTNQVAVPCPSSWGEGGHLGVWLNETNQWILPHLQVAQERMTELARRAERGESGGGEAAGSLSKGEGGTGMGTGTTKGGAEHEGGSSRGLVERGVKQAARELLLAQASDWPFILRTGTSPEYARKRVTEHLLRFTRLYEQLIGGSIDEKWLGAVEGADNIFPNIESKYWR